MTCKYTLEWLDTAVASSLKHLESGPSVADGGQLASVIDDAPLRAAEVQSSIKQQLFSLTKERHAELLIRQYHTALIALYDMLLEHYPASRAAGGILADVFTCLSEVLSGLLAFIEKRHHRLLSLDERVPPSYMHTAGSELKQRIDRLTHAIERKTSDSALAAAVGESLAVHTFSLSMTFRELLYRKDILQCLEEMASRGKKACTTKAVNDLLVYMNFNSKPYITYLTQALTAQLDEQGSDNDKASLLLLARKEFYQAHRMEGVRLNSHDANLKDTMGNWFEQELEYLQRRERVMAIPDKGLQSKEAAGGGMQKLMCSLSVDQIALLIRSADESKILVCRSVNAVFKTLVPFLSTEGRNDISADSMRSKSYSAERRDKEVVIARLEEMISVIKTY